MIYRLQAVTKHFGKTKETSPVLKNVTLDIGEGERVVLLGPSGAGKTTLFRLLNASIFATSGRVMYRGSDVARMNSSQSREMRRHIGSVYQQHYLVGEVSVLMNTLSGALGRWGLASTLLNLVTPRAIEVERAEECLKAVGLKEKRNARCDQLSGGQQQRLAIARTLMQKPEVILADEPVASLDPRLSEEILDLLVSLAEEGRHTLLISLHQVQLALRYATRIVGLRSGEIVFDVAAAELNAESLTELFSNGGEALERRP